MSKDQALTKTEYKKICECCNKFKLCKMFVLQSGEAAWVCSGCRNGRKK